MNKEPKTKKAKDDEVEVDYLQEQLESFFKDTEGYYGTLYESVDSGFENEVKIPTGSRKLDMVLDGGFNAGSMSLFFGDKESGKTGQGLTWAANWLKYYGERARVVFFDAEGRITGKKIRMSGIDKKHLKVVRSNSAEDILQNVLNLIAINPHDYKYFFIIDSINALTTADERGKTLSEAEARAGVARVSSMAFKKLSLPLHVKGHHLYVISQIRAGNMTGFGGAGNKAGGGKAPEFYGDLISQMGQAWEKSSPKVIKDGEKLVGRYTQYDFRKTYNETTGVKLEVPIKFNHEGGVWQASEIADLALEWGIAIKKGSWYNFQNELLKASAEKAGVDIAPLEKSVQGSFGLVTLFEENEDLANLIFAYIQELMR